MNQQAPPPLPCLISRTQQSHYLVNGEVLPSIELVSGQWMRFRMAFAGHGNSHAISILDPDGNCEMGVLAKDGVYLSEVPRVEPKLFFTAASRYSTVLLIKAHFFSRRYSRPERDGQRETC